MLDCVANGIETGESFQRIFSYLTNSITIAFVILIKHQHKVAVSTIDTQTLNSSTASGVLPAIYSYIPVAVSILSCAPDVFVNTTVCMLAPNLVQMTSVYYSDCNQSQNAELDRLYQAIC